MLTETEIERYSRQLILSDWGAEKQEALKEVSVTIPASLPSAALYLAAAGVGCISLYEDTDLPSRLLALLDQLNPHTKIEVHQTPHPPDDCCSVVIEKVTGKLLLSGELVPNPAEIPVDFEMSLCVPSNLLVGTKAAMAVLNSLKTAL